MIKRKHRKLWPVIIVLFLVSIGIFSNDNARAVTSCDHTIKDFNVSPNPASSTSNLNLKVVVNRSGTICTLPGKTSYTAYFYYTSAAAGGADNLISVQEAESYFNGDTQISLTIIPKDKGIVKGSYIFWADVRVVQNSLTLKSAGVEVNIEDGTGQKFSCNQNNQCVPDQAGEYSTRADCQKKCGKSGSGNSNGSGGGSSGRDQPFATSIEFPPPSQNRDLRDLVKTISGWLFKISIPIAIVVIILSGATLLLSQGKPEVVKRGRKMLTYAVVGLAIILIGKGFFTLIRSILELRGG